jgi:hypothetical protein
MGDRYPRRTVKEPERFIDLTFVPGANNQHTVGRVIDTYEHMHEHQQGFRAPHNEEDDRTLEANDNDVYEEEFIDDSVQTDGEVEEEDEDYTDSEDDMDDTDDENDSQ